MCWMPLYANKQKQRKQDMSLPQTTGGKDEPNILLIQKSKRTSQHEIMITVLNQEITKYFKTITFIQKSENKENEEINTLSLTYNFTITSYDFSGKKIKNKHKKD